MKNKLLISGLLLFLILIPVKIYSQCYEPVWSEEFDYTGFPNPEYWTFETGGDGWGNNELQYYKANDEDNAWVDNGLLTIKAIQESYGGRNYTSARIKTSEKFNFKYGKIEARMKLPYGQGIWPAFWIMGESISEVGWPACGELDIMEMVGGDDSDNKVHGTAHWDNNGSHAQYGGTYTLGSGIFADDYHTFSVEWDNSSVRWYVDDIQYHVMSITPSGLSEFHGDFFIILNLAVGGQWPGSPDASTVFPQTLEVDYIRVFKTTSMVNQMEIEGNEILPVKGAGAVYSIPYSPSWDYDWTIPEDAEIIGGQGTSEINVNWGCTAGTINCNITGECDSYQIEKEIQVDNSIYGPVFVSENENNVLFYTDSLAGSSFSWVFPGGTEIVDGQGTDSVYVNWGDNFEPVVLNIENNCGNQVLNYSVIKAGQYPYPELNQPHEIPGTIEATEYDYGGEGVAYHDISLVNEGPGPRQDESVDTEYGDNGSPNVGWIRNGEWLEYTVSVESASWYKLRLRVATANASGGPFSFWFNDEEKLNGITVSNTGAWDSFQTLEAGSFYLSPEDTIMRLDVSTGNFNLGRMIFSTTTDPTGIQGTDNTDILTVFPVPAVENIQIMCEKEMDKIEIFNTDGKIFYSEIVKGLNSLSLNIHEYSPGIYFMRIRTIDGQQHFRKILKAEVRN